MLWLSVGRKPAGLCRLQVHASVYAALATTYPSSSKCTEMLLPCTCECRCLHRGIVGGQPRCDAAGCVVSAVMAAAGMSAAEQRDALWAQIESSAYASNQSLPGNDDLGLSSTGLFIPPFLWQTFFHQGDTMPRGAPLPFDHVGLLSAARNLPIVSEDAYLMQDMPSPSTSMAALQRWPSGSARKGASNLLTMLFYCRLHPYVSALTAALAQQVHGHLCQRWHRSGPPVAGHAVRQLQARCCLRICIGKLL